MAGERIIQVVTDAGLRSVSVASGRTIAQGLSAAGIFLNMRCGGRGLCEGCGVEVAGQMVRGCQHVIGDEVGPIRLPARSLLAQQPQIVTDFRLNVSRAHDPLGAAEGLGAAIDIGTTTVAVLIVELATGKVVGRAAAFNRQMEMGEDVVTRIGLCCHDEEAVGRLQRAVVEETILPLLREALGERDPHRLSACVVAGNTTMLHLFAGVNPAPMGTAPFTPVFLEHRLLAAGQVRGWRDEFAPACAIHLLPGAAAYVGADLTAGILASGLLYDAGPSLLVDVGTNGEIVLAKEGRYWGCATAAGPAFEGAGLSSGVRAGDGAIGHLRISPEGQVDIEVIGNAAPIGLCGSGYVDFLAEARRAGWINAMGRFELKDERVSARPGSGKALRLAGEGPRAIVISEGDIARLLTAKAAIAAGVLILLRRCGVRPAEVKKVYLAGGFGTHLSAGNAIACGLLPGFEGEQIEAVGNSALGGAYLALLDRTALQEMEQLCRRIEIIELNREDGFEETYIEQLALP